MTTPENNPDKMDRLISAAVQLTKEVEELARDSGTQFVSLSKTARRNRLLIVVTIFSLVIDVALTVVLAIIGVGMQRNTDRIDQVATETQQVQTAQRQRALCPLYGIFKDSRSAAGRERAPDPKKYDHAFEVIEEGYLFLECDRYLKESGKNSW